MRSGLVALAGRPNVGKSTIVNAICAEKVAIVSDKPQTTRRRISGVWSNGDCQLVLIDLPGFQRPRDTMTERMQKTVDKSFEGIDGVLFVISADEYIGSGDEFIARRVFAGDVPIVIAVNKVDRVKPTKIAEQISRISLMGNFYSIHPISAKTGDGIGMLRNDLLDLLPAGPALFPEGIVTDQTLEERVAELVREQALRFTHDELPHAVGVQLIGLSESCAEVWILVEKESQKQILIGTGGSMVKKIGSGARSEIEKMLGHSIFLDLRIKVRKDWRQRPADLSRLGI